ncbi:LarC family nickel insertion protein [Irregularibacter muris]|uniref:LarC family nickel insertion protein n=1 Tax=Irregularibacter muris TaxID=1796619 RepID=UPI00358DCA81
MNNQILYLECYSGISGDMTVSALLDLGADQEVLKEALKSLNVEGYEIQIGRREKCGIDACSFDVILKEEKHQHEHSHNHVDPHHDHIHGEEHHHHEHSHHHIHRNIKDIQEIIDNAQMSDRAKNLSKKIFHVVAKAEAKAHGILIDEVHFHEVGAVDSIVDIVAVAVCLDNLNIHEVVISDLYEGVGHVKCQHGILPVPVPAVVNIVMDHALPLQITDIHGELVTPTGAAIAAAIKTKDALPSSYKIKNIGIGSGKKDFPKANILRAYIIEDDGKKKQMF